MKMISVCIPTYNQEAYIEQAINGVFEQKECNRELIIANDGSTDATYDICKTYRLSIEAWTFIVLCKLYE